MWCCWPRSSDLGHVARADSPPWLTSLSPVRHISLVARENMVTGFFPSTCLMIGSCPTRPSSWTRFMAETRETKHTYRWTSNHGKPQISSFCQGLGSQLPASPNHFSTSCDWYHFTDSAGSHSVLLPSCLLRNLILSLANLLYCSHRTSHFQYITVTWMVLVHVVWIMSISRRAYSS